MDVREHRRRARARYVVLVLALTTAPGADAGEDVREVGFIESFSGAADGYLLERRGEAVAFGVFESLEVGDRLDVRADDGEITLQLGGGTVTLTAADDPFVVEPGVDEVSVSANVVEWVGSFLEEQADAGTGVSLVSRSVDLAAPLLEAAPVQQIGAGERPLFLAWQGGEAPYTVHVLGPDGKGDQPPVVGLVEPRVALAAIRLEPGMHRVEISDSMGTTLALAFEAVPALAASGGALASEAAPEPLRETLEAVWLCSQGERYRLAAYQRVAPLVGSYPPAARVAEAIEAGHDAPPPPQP